MPPPFVLTDPFQLQFSFYGVEYLVFLCVLNILGDAPLSLRSETLEDPTGSRCSTMITYCGDHFEGVVRQLYFTRA